MNYFPHIKTISLLVFISACIFTAPSLIGQELNEQAMHFVKMVQKRYYLVHRLEKPITFLVRFNKYITKKDFFTLGFFFGSHGDKDTILPVGISEQFQHPLIIKYMKALEERHNINVINDLWSDFLSYKYVEDELFVRETIVAIMVVYKALALKLNGATSQRGGSLFEALLINPPSEDEDIVSKQELYENFHSILDLLGESFDKEDFVITNNLRHYHIQRLLKSIIILTKVNAHYLDPLWDCLTQTINKNSISFKHPQIQECLEAILRTRNLEPLFALWRHFTAYKFANDSLFLQEFVTLEYMLYCKLIDCLRITALKDVPTAEDIIELYSTIATLPIPEMLNSLDSLVEDLIEIIEKYELDTAMSWTQWFKKYWWVPPVIISSLVINFLLNHRTARILLGS